MFFEKEINQDVLLDFVEKSVSIESYRKESSQFLKQIQYQKTVIDTELIVSELWYEADQIDRLILGFFELFSEKHDLKDSEIDVLRGVDSSEFKTLSFYCLWTMRWSKNKEIAIYLKTGEYDYLPEITIKANLKNLTRNFILGDSIKEFYGTLVRFMLSENNAEADLQ